MPKTITIPAAGELNLTLESELHKLPTEAAHNHFHRLADQADKIQEQAKAVSLVSLILCGLELMHLQETLKKGAPHPQNGAPANKLQKHNWKQWVAENCEFGHTTAAKYIKAAKCAQLGMIDGLDADLVPTCAPSQLSKAELQDACTALANGLQGFGSRRQLYLELDMIKTPQRDTIDDNRQKKGTYAAPPTDPEAAQNEQPTYNPDQERAEATETFRIAVNELSKAFKIGHHESIHPDTTKELIEQLTALIDLLKKTLK